MIVLGINAYNHEPSVCLIVDGKVAAAVEEAKISRQKYITDFPSLALADCLSIAGIEGPQIDVIAIPRQVKLELAYHAGHLAKYFPKSLNLLKDGSAALDSKVKSKRYMKLTGELKALSPKARIIEVPHHECHAMSAYYQSEYKNAMSVVVDGIGEYDTAWIGEINEAEIRKHQTVQFPHSLGMLYAAVTEFMGFRPFSDEWKVMGMAAYGVPRYYEELENIAAVNSDLTIEVNQDLFAFRYYGRRKWFSDKFKLSRFQRDANDPITQEHYDFTASFQAVFEDKLLSLFRLIRKKFPHQKDVALSGGVFLNSLFNGKLAASGIYDGIYVDCDPGDAGSAMGAALHAYKELTGTLPARNDHDNRLGRGFSNAEIEQTLNRQGIKYAAADDPAQVVPLMEQGKIVGLFDGRSEFGPRALGFRSIIADARDPQAKDRINSKVKYRESFRPYAPSVLAEHQAEFFKPDVFSPYMSFAIKANPEHATKIPAVVHNDGTSRIQSVRPREGKFHQIIKAFHERHGIPVILNTSFNIRGEPIVYTPEDAVDTFKKGNLDALLIGDFLVTK